MIRGGLLLVGAADAQAAMSALKTSLDQEKAECIKQHIGTPRQGFR